MAPPKLRAKWFAFSKDEVKGKAACRILKPPKKCFFRLKESKKGLIERRGSW
jgi:hypothetical protein